MPKRKRGAEISLAGMGFDLAAAVGVGVLFGLWIDRRFETAPWGTIICATVGIVGGLLNFVRAGQRAARRAAERGPGEPHPDDSGGERG